MRTFLLPAMFLGLVGVTAAQDADPADDLRAFVASLESFQLAMPWKSLKSEPEFVRRNRGAAHHIRALLNSSAVDQKYKSLMASHFARLSANRESLLQTAQTLDEESGAYYRENLKFDVLRVLVDVISEGKKSFHCAASQLNDVYYSMAEGRSQSFQVVLPPDYSPDRKYPLFVQVFGSNALQPTRERPFIRVRPNGRGVWGYRSMSRYDVLQVIRQAKSGYSVDENRVYLTGTSAGATGAMHAAACRQDIFAGVVPLVAFGMDLPLENFCSLPVRCEHGANDWTSAICNVRVQFQKLAQLQNDVVLNEHPTGGHGIRLPPPKTMDWLFEQNRNPSRRHVVHTCEHPRDGRAYWLRIDSLADPHQVARIEAQANADRVLITTTNIRELSLDRATMPVRPGEPVSIDGVELSVRAGDDWQRFSRDSGGNWQAHPNQLTGTSAVRKYGAGAAGNLFQGEPLLVIYGTGGDSVENAFLSRAAGILARSGGPHFRAASVRFPVRSDSMLGDVPLEHYNLLIVGTPENNHYLRRLSDRLPYSVDASTLTAGSRLPLALNGAVLSSHYFNPDHPDQLIYVVSPYVTEDQRSLFLKNPRHFLAGSDGFKMIDQPDLLVRGVDRRIRSEMQFDSDWKYIEREGHDMPLPDRFSDRTHLATSHMKVMRKGNDIDLALWWGPEDKGAFGGYDFNWLPELDPRSYTRADYLVRQREVECMTAAIPGDELLHLFDRWVATKEIITEPVVKKSDIVASRDYRIALPMDLVVKLGNRRKTLLNVAPAPHVMPDEVAREIFQ